MTEPQTPPEQKPAEQLFQELMQQNNLVIGVKLDSFLQDNGTFSLKPVLNVAYKS